MSVILTDHDNHVLQITINRPEKKNALTLAMYKELALALDHAEQNDSVHVILLQGQPAVFSSGNDIHDFLNRSTDELLQAIAPLLRAISTAKKPIIAAVTGSAIGIGATMLLHCDLVYCSENATLGFPFVKLGLCPEAASSYLLPSFIGYQKAAELLFFGEPFSAEKAFELGLVTALCPEADTMTIARQKADSLALLPAKALQVTKSLLKNRLTPLVQEAMRVENESFSTLLQSPEAKEAFRAFLEKRPANFSRHF